MKFTSDEPAEQTGEKVNDPYLYSRGRTILTEALCGCSHFVLPNVAFK
jgi:hypothetical protein